MYIKKFVRKFFAEHEKKNLAENIEYVYLWLNNYQELDDFGRDKYLVENQGFCLSPKYNVTHNYVEKEIEFRINKNDKYLGYIYKDVENIKAFVGKNGCGKTTILRRLFKIIGSGFGNEGEDSFEYILIFKRGEKFYYYKSKKVKIEISCNEKICPNNNYKSNLAVFYTGAVLDQSITSSTSADKCYDISMNGLMPIDYENIHNKTASINSTDFFSAYTIMDMTRKIIFACRFYDVFVNNTKGMFRIPNSVSIVPSNIDIDNAIIEISKKNDQRDELVEDKWKNIKRMQKNFREKFCFAALLNHLKAFNANKEWILKECYNPDFYKNKKIEDIIRAYSEYAGEKKLIEEKEFCQDIFNALEILESQCDEKTEYVKELEKKFFSCIINLDNKKQRDALEKFVYHYQKLNLKTPFIMMHWRAQSSGEENFIKIFARIYYILSKEKEQSTKSPSEITLFIDEADLYMHPHWQCHWLWEFINIYKEIMNMVYGSNYPKLQLFISTHSPFIITDLQEENIVMMRRDEGRTPLIVDRKTKINPFGSNIYELFKTGFFLDDYIGILSKNIIEEAIEKITSGDYKEKEMSRSIIRKIGDRVLNSLIQEMDDEK